jgi:hypothetical protein
MVKKKYGMTSELSEALQKTKFSVTRKFIDPKNPFHNLFLKNLKKNSLQIFNIISKLYINNKFDISLPISFSGVRITDELPFLDYLEKNENILVKAYAIYRQGRLQEAQDLLRDIYTRDAILLKLIISIYLKKNFSKLIKYKFNKKIINNKKNKIINDWKYKKKFLVNFYLKKFTKKDFFHYKYLGYKLVVSNFLKNKIVTKELLKYKKFLLTDLSFTRGLAKSSSSSAQYLKIISKIFHSKNKIFYTSEVMSGYILSIYLEKNFTCLERYYNKRHIIIDKFNIKELGPIINDLNFNSKKFIADFNTSNLNGRFYSTNLNYGYKINKIFRKKLQSLTKKFLNIYSRKINYIQQIQKKGSFLWYDYSSNKKSSLIKEHLHTAGLYRANIFTIVLYLNVPKTKKQKDGNLRVFDKEIPIFDEFIKVKTGDIVVFPSYFFHETTPTKSKDIRKTINLDYVVKLQQIKL